MDECARRSKARTHTRLLHLEPLEDRFLLSALVAPAAGPPTDPSAVQQSRPTTADAASPIGKAATAVTAPAATGTSGKQAASLTIAPSTPAPDLHPLAAASNSTPSPAPPAVISTGYREHDGDDRAAEYAEHQEWGSAHELVAEDCADSMSSPTGGDPCAHCCHEVSSASPASGVALSGMPAFWGAALGVRGDAAARVAAHSQPTSATEEDAVASLPDISEKQEPETIVTAAKAAEPAEVMQAPNLVPAFLGPLAGLAPFDLEGVEKSIDTFFSHLTEMAQGLSATQIVAHATPWMIAVTAVALEIARRRRKTTEGLEIEASGVPGWPGSFSGGAT